MATETEQVTDDDYARTQQRPADPAWASQTELDRIRKALRGLDTRLDFWWSPKHKRWQVMERGATNGIWSFVFAYAHEDGTPRLPSSPQGLLSKLGEIDASRHGGTGDYLEHLERAGAGRRASVMRNVETERKAMLGVVHDHARRVAGEKVTTGPGGKRSRAFLYGADGEAIKEIGQGMKDAMDGGE